MSPRDRILARRAKFMAAAFVGITGCSDDATPRAAPEPCLSSVADTGTRDTGADTRDAADTEPMVCLTAPLDTGSEDTADTNIEDSTTTTEDTSVKDTGPMPCLTPPPDEP